MHTDWYATEYNGFVGTWKQTKTQRACTARSGAHAGALAARGIPRGIQVGLLQSAGLNAILAAAGGRQGGRYTTTSAVKPWDTPSSKRSSAPDNRGQWLRPLENW